MADAKEPSRQDVQLTDSQVRHVAKLSRLALSDSQVRRFSEQLSTVLVHVAKLRELDVHHVEPMAHALDVTNVWRQDQPQSGIAVQAVLANAPETHPPFFKVPKVLDEGSGA